LASNEFFGRGDADPIDMGDHYENKQHKYN